MADQVQYTADLESPGHIEVVEYLGPGIYADEATFQLKRFGRPVTTFVASKGQWSKIQRGKGKLNITSRMIQRAAGRRAPAKSHMTKGRAGGGRTMSEAREAGDSFQLETMDGKHHLYMPGSRGVKQTLANARKGAWKHRIGQRVRVYRVLPGSRIGAMMLEEHSEATL